MIKLTKEDGKFFFSLIIGTFVIRVPIVSHVVKSYLVFGIQHDQLIYFHTDNDQLTAVVMVANAKSVKILKINKSSVNNFFSDNVML